MTSTPAAAWTEDERNPPRPSSGRLGSIAPARTRSDRLVRSVLSPVDWDPRQSAAEQALGAVAPSTVQSRIIHPTARTIAWPSSHAAPVLRSPAGPITMRSGNSTRVARSRSARPNHSIFLLMVRPSPRVWELSKLELFESVEESQ
jgi:uncharacterized protein (DUF2342 family)